ncbi:MAG: hypothetical protein COU07_02185 [Candidatus Harrisonbacteria bacterium CG10_big_fil_rev_8_21_14_0_10_40_38]|uniref:Small-conductance mechanosensitive ion channel n=1 Tax=Candidatus Harrisonbacteria bacterium CG10_big_fil_rev_8_21_14_0_10_40_38 TaxID=1974583 RepID=A0A2H0US52_9BACT|nr:MAG: hypothetical protein COU07_02185 [Candidatus Harrisonbacteria bacterium CG10_big_fil_rev_8_21_14_0_10_40_38]
MTVQTWIDAFVGSFQELLLQVAGFLPDLIGAIILLIIGLIVASGLERLVERLVYYLKVDSLLRQTGFDGFLARSNMRLNAGVFLGRLVYWFFLVLTFLAASNVLGLSDLSAFLREVLHYIPRVIVASLILLVALVAANFVKGLVRASVMGAKLHAAKSLSMIAWWGIVVFGFLAALVQLGVAVQVINTLITGLVAMLALAGGLAFGLGGKDHAHQWLSKIRDEMTHHK